MSRENEQEYKQLSQLQHVKLRPNTYIGSISVQPIEMYCLHSSDKFNSNYVVYSPGCLKIIDEICVNAVDHYIRHPKKVNKIDISFDIKNGTISIKNNGPGIPIKLVDTLNDGKKYQPEAIFSQFLSGTNFVSEERIVGGMNGIGAKAANAFSELFCIETIYKNKYYKQIFRNQLEIIELPEIKTKVDTSEEYTKITFIPAYKSLGYEEYNEAVGKNLYKLVQSRAFQIAAFIGKNCSVSFIKEIIHLDSFSSFASMFLEEHKDNGDEIPQQIYTTTLSNPHDKKLDMEVCIGISDGKFRCVSLINGINVFMGGSHIKHIQNEIILNLRDKVEKELNKSKDKSSKINDKIISNLILNNLFIFVPIGGVGGSSVTATNQGQTGGNGSETIVAVYPEIENGVKIVSAYGGNGGGAGTTTSGGTGGSSRIAGKYNLSILGAYGISFSSYTDNIGGNGGASSNGTNILLESNQNYHVIYPGAGGGGCDSVNTTGGGVVNSPGGLAGGGRGIDGFVSSKFPGIMYGGTGGSSNIIDVGGNGGNGCAPGTGGGGGGGGTTASGRGGDCGPGCVIIQCW